MVSQVSVCRCGCIQQSRVAAPAVLVIKINAAAETRYFMHVSFSGLSLHACT